MRHKILLISSVGMIVLIGTVIWFGCWLPHARATEVQSATAPSSSTSGSAGLTTRHVEVVTPQRRTVSRVLDVPATIETFERADLYAKTSGYVAQVHVDIGDHVKANDTLVTLDIPEMADELAQAEAVLHAKEAKLAQAQSLVQTAHAQLDRFNAELSLKKITLQRKQELRAGNAIPDQELDQARSELEIAEAQIKIGIAKIADAQADVKVAESEIVMAQAAIGRLNTLREYATIKAPFDGVVTNRMIDRGALVQAATTSRTTPLLTVQRVDQFRIFIDVPEPDVDFVRSGVVAKIKPYGLSGESIVGAVARISASLNPNTRTMRTEIDLPNPDGRLFDGMYAQIRLEIDPHADALTIPADALLTEGKETYVFTVQNDRAVRTPIKTGLDDGIHVEVTQGLEDGSQVITTGKSLVADGSLVKAVRKAGGS